MRAISATYVVLVSFIYNYITSARRTAHATLIFNSAHQWPIKCIMPPAKPTTCALMVALYPGTHPYISHNNNQQKTLSLSLWSTSKMMNAILALNRCRLFICAANIMYMNRANEERRDIVCFVRARHMMMHIYMRRVQRVASNLA